MSQETIKDLSKYKLTGRLRKGEMNARMIAEALNLKAWKHGDRVFRRYQGQWLSEQAIEAARRSQREGGTRSKSKARANEAYQTSKGKYEPLTEKELKKVLKIKADAKKRRLDADHMYGKAAYDSGRVEHPEFRQALDPQINRYVKPYDEKALSQHMLATELRNPSASMPLEETLDAAYKFDSRKKLEASKWYTDTIHDAAVHRGIGGYQRQFEDPTTGMWIDQDTQFAIQQQKAAQESAQTFTDRPFWNTVEDALSKPFTTDPSSELAGLGVWHDGPTLEDSWVKISRELNLESGKFDDATGVFHYSKDPTARTSIDILSDIGQGEGEFGDIVNLKNKFHGLKRSLPPGEYYLHADNPTKAKYYQRVFANDPWIGPSGEQGGGRLKSGEFVKYDTLKLTVPEAPEQFAQAQDGPWPRWQDQGVPRTQLSSEASDVARRTGALNVASDVGTLGRRVGAVLPFVGAGFDAWDVQARYHEMINNPNEGFADWLDKAQFGIASATLGTSFWAEPANAILGLGNLGIDAIRTVVEEDKRKEFGQMMRGIGQFATKLF